MSANGWRTLATILVMFSVNVSCGSQANTSLKHPGGNATDLCNQLAEIKILPYNKDEKVEDAAYNRFAAAGPAAFPCLIQSITNTSPMTDPRNVPRYSDIKVGDVAYFVLYRLARFDFIAPLPDSVQQKYKKEGVAAYFEFINAKEENRRWLQNRLSEWQSQRFVPERPSPQVLCSRLPGLKFTPSKPADYGVDDPIYNDLIEAGEEVLPCLLQNITNTEAMPDPRMAPKYAGNKVGDVAYFVFCRVAKLNITEFLPASVQKQFPTEGVYAYFHYASDVKNRHKLQKRLHEWYQQKYGKSS